MKAKKIAVRLLVSFIFACAVALPVAAPAQALICQWTGAVSNAWDNLGNWNCGKVPGDLDVVDIVKAGYDPVLNGSTQVSQVNIYGGAITPGGNLTIVSGATLTTDILNLNGQISGLGSVVVRNTWNWGSDVNNRTYPDGRLSGGGQITIQTGARGKFHHISTDIAHLDNYTIHNYGIIEPFSDYIILAMTGGAVIHNYGTMAPDGRIFDDYLVLGYNSSIVNHSGATLTINNQTISESHLDTVLINDGTLEIKKGSLFVCSGSPQSGSFTGLADGTLNFGYCDDYDRTPTGDITFTSTSSITVPHIKFVGKPSRSVSLAGTLGPIGTSSSSEFGLPVTIQSSATVNSFGDKLTVYYPLTISAGLPNNMTRLDLVTSVAQWNYAGTVTVWSSLSCTYGATLTGGGVLRAKEGGILTLSGSSGGTACRLDNFTLENLGTATWSYSTDIVGLNASNLRNFGTFTSNNGDRMSGSLTFQNEYLLVKTGTGTTTIDVPFTNNGYIDVLAGSLVFTQDVTLPATSDNTINGTFQAANLINNGNLVVSGTVDGNLTNNGYLELDGTVTGNLNNAGTIAPGSSPGIALVGGDFYQTSDGALEIDLSGASPSAGSPVSGVDYDLLQVTGSADLAGHVQFFAGDTFNPHQYGVELPFLTAVEGVTGAFDTYDSNFNDYYPIWSMIQRSNQVVFHFADGIFLPMIRR